MSTAVVITEIDWRQEPRGSLERERARFWSKVDVGTSCWLWTGNTDRTGYGRYSFRRDGRTIFEAAHRYAFKAAGHAIPEGLVLDHLCRNRACVNPEHLEAVSNRVNILRGAGQTARNARKTHCQQGHPFTPENTYRTSDGARRCVECRRTDARERPIAVIVRSGESVVVSSDRVAIGDRFVIGGRSADIDRLITALSQIASEGSDR